MAHNTTVTAEFKRIGKDGALAWADHIIETLEHEVRAGRRDSYALADLILKGDKQSLFMAQEMAKLIVEIRELRQKDGNEWEPKP